MQQPYNATYINHLKEYLHYLEQLGYQKCTRTTMQSCLREFFYKMEQQAITAIDQVGPQDILNHYGYLQQRPKKTGPGALSESMVSSHIFAIKTFFLYKEQQGIIQTNPFSSLHFASPIKKEREILSKEEIQQLYEACNDLRDKAILSLYYGCGLRKTEGERLNIQDIGFKKQLLYVREGKGRKRRVVPMADKVKEDLENYCYHERGFYVKDGSEDSRQAFLLNRHGKRLKGNSSGRRLKDILEKAGLPNHYSLHNLRHSIATHLLESGTGLEKVRDFLGHSELETTQIYTRISKIYLHGNT